MKLINEGRKIDYVFNHKARFTNDINYEIYDKLGQGEDGTSEKIKHIMPYKHRNHIFKDKYFRLNENKPSRTITAHLRMDCLSHIHPTQTRTITPREAARIQSFPDDYLFLGAYLKTYMQIGNAIDIKDKKCVRLIKGDFNNKTEYETSPVDQAGKYKDHGFKNLHIVDLDGALTGETVNLDIIKEIVHKFDLKIEVGGGIRTIDSIQKYTDIGVEKVILGSAAIKDKNFLKEACQKFPNKIALGLDAKDGYLSVSGWKENSNQLTLDFLKEVNDYGASRLIYTDIDRDGTKQSPNFEETTNVANVSNCPVIISGGVSSIDDIKKAKGLKNIEGIIVGKAIYDGDIKLDELVRELDA